MCLLAVCADCSSPHFDSFALVVAVAVAARASPRFFSSVCSSPFSLPLLLPAQCVLSAAPPSPPAFSPAAPGYLLCLLCMLSMPALPALAALAPPFPVFCRFCCLVSACPPVCLSTVRCLLSVRCRFSHISPIVYIWQVVHTQSRQRVRLGGCSRDVLSLPLNLSHSLALSAASAACS